MRTSLKLLVTALLPVVTACASSGGTSMSGSANVRAAVDRQNAQFVAAANAGRINELLALYAPDAVVLAPNAPPVIGQVAIQQFWNAVAGMRMRNVTLQTDQFEVHGDVAIETGSYTMTLNPPGAPGDINDRGKYLVVWKRQPDGSWKIYRDMFSSNLPMN